VDPVEFGRYRLLGLIGEGGMGQVFKAYDTQIGRDVAIKVLPIELAAEPGYQERFRREAHTAAQLTEPHIIPIFDVGEIDGRLYLVMPVIDGIDVAGLLKRDGPMSPRLAVRVIEQLASALGAAHEHGLVHRDVKPSNALMTSHEFVYLIDFGVAHSGSATKLTRTGSVLGTLAYMAPERFTTGTADPRADIYALACVLHECLTGDQPFPGDSMEQQIAGHLTLDPPMPSRQLPGVPAAFDDIIACGMAKNPSHRYQSAQDLCAAAEQALTESTSAPGQHTAATLIDGSDHGRHAISEAVAREQPADRIHAATHASMIEQPTIDAGIQQSMKTASTDQSTPPRSERTAGHKRRILVIAGAAVVIVAIVAVIGYLVFERSAPMQVTYSEQVALPFTSLNDPNSVAVDSSGTIYVSDSHGTDSTSNPRVLKLPAGSSSPTTLPLTGLNDPEDLAVDNTSNVYVADFSNNRVLGLAAGSDSPTILPFRGLSGPDGVVVDNTGSVYVADTGNKRVLKLAAGSDSPTTLPFTGLNQPQGVAVDNTGNVYVTDTFNYRVLKLPVG
jgi:serine/threonine-protein kinase